TRDRADGGPHPLAHGARPRRIARRRSRGALRRLELDRGGARRRDRVRRRIHGAWARAGAVGYVRVRSRAHASRARAARARGGTMRTPTQATRTVSGYIAAAPAPARAMLRQLRAAVRAAAPQAEERISYGMPYYYDRGRLVYFAAFKRHVSLFVWGPILKRHAASVRKYQTTSATLQFPLGTPLPLALIKRLVSARRRENARLEKKKG